MAQEPRLLPDGSPDHPDLPYKPPLAYLLAIAIGFGIDHWWPMDSRPEGWLPLGVTVVAIGVGLVLWAKATFDAKDTPLEPWKPSKAVVDGGPFAFSRNPVYAGFAIIQLGIGLWSDRLAVVVLVILPMALTALVIVPREERYLRRKFGAEYQDYCSRVRRWF